MADHESCVTSLDLPALTAGNALGIIGATCTYNLQWHIILKVLLALLVVAYLNTATINTGNLSGMNVL